MTLAITIITLLTTVVGGVIWFYQRKAQTPTRQERIDISHATRQELQQLIDEAIAMGDHEEVTRLTQQMLFKIRQERLEQEVNTTAVRRRSQIHPPIVFAILNSQLLILNCAMALAMCVGCAAQKDLIVVSADREITHIKPGEISQREGYLVPAARMKEILEALADEQLKSELGNAQEVSP